MIAHIELTPSERRMMLTLDDEEREVVIEQMLDKVREELGWELTVDRAKAAAAAAPQLVARVEQPLSPAPVPPVPPPLPARHRWPSGARRAAR